MRWAKRRGFVLIVISVFVMVFGTACDPSNTAAQTAVDQVADEMIEEGKTLFAPSDTPPPPTDTPVPPTDTPVPTPTEVKVGMVDEEGDCEVVDGSIGEEGCQIDLASVYVDPCAKDKEFFYEVEFAALPDAVTWEVCFTINSDHDPETGFNDEPVRGIDYVYCYVNEEQIVILNRFDTWGDYAGDIPVPDTWSSVVQNPEGGVLTTPFGMYFPPPEVPDLVLADPYEIYAEGHYYNPTTGDWVWDRAGPVEVPSCPY